MKPLFNISGFLILLYDLLVCTSFAQTEFNTTLMNSTYKIYGVDKIDSNKINIGTCFIVGKQVSNDSNFYSFVLVTAKHVLDGINNDFAFLELRLKDSINFYDKVPFKIKIKNNGIPIWNELKDSSIDIAAMFIPLPEKFVDQFSTSFLPMSFLSNDSIFESIEIHPGDNLFCLGYPAGISSNDFGFPVLRSGLISSYPLFPSTNIKSFLLDTEVYQGNSGGPVYLYQQSRVIEMNNVFKTFATIVGILTQQILYPDELIVSDSITLKENKPLKLAKVIPAHFIRQVINTLPEVLK